MSRVRQNVPTQQQAEEQSDKDCNSTIGDKQVEVQVGEDIVEGNQLDQSRPTGQKRPGLRNLSDTF